MISQKEYLKRYLQKDPDKKAKKKKKKHEAISSSTHLKRSVVIDDDVNVNDLPVGEDGELDLEQLGDEAPQVVGIIDERPEIVKLEEKYKSGKWRPLAEEGGYTESKMGGDKRTYFEAEEEGRKKQDVAKRSDDSDLSPPRVNPKRVSDDKRRDSTAIKSNKRAADGSDSDVDVPRQRRRSDSTSPAPKGIKRHREEPVRKRRGDRKGSDSDMSPPRRDRSSRDESRMKDRSRDRLRRGSDSDTEVPRKRRTHGSDSDLSPPRHSRKGNSQRDKKSEKTTDSRNSSRWDDSSRRGSSSKKREEYSDLSPPRRGNNRGGEPRNRVERSNSDLSPPRRRKSDHEPDLSPPRRRRAGKESDLSSPRRSKDGNDSDLSPPRKSRGQEDKRVRPEKADQMGDGKRAGLQDAKSLKDELRLLKEKEDEMFRKMDPELLGARSVAVVRDRKTGLKRDFEKEREVERQKAAKAAVRQRKYEKWGKGLKQIQEQEEKVADMIHEMSKPLARYAGDDDLERALKAQEREGDPMLEYIKRHQKDSHTIDLTVGGVRKKYMGSFPPNRFNIAPGHRWDGVDRSNGYEPKWFAAKNAKLATAEEAWKWSSADM